MIDIQNIKNATIGLGLIDTNLDVRVVGGSGIMIDSRGYFLTATHVLEELLKIRSKLANPDKGEKLTTRPAIISYVPNPDGTFSFVTNMIDKWAPFHLKLDELSFENIDFDIAIGKTKVKEKNHPILNISKRQNFSPLENIFMCGYPGGNTTLNPYGDVTKLSFSPMIENNTIGSLFPADDAPTHQGMLLNIVTTGGSSGSPIIDENNEIVGVAQWVIGGPLFAKTKYEDSVYIQKDNELIETTLKKTALVTGYSQVGKVFALSSAMFSDAYNVIEQLESGSDKITGLNINPSTAEFIKSVID